MSEETKSLEDELAQLEHAREAKRRARESKDAASVLKRKIADQRALIDAEEKYGMVATVETPDGLVIMHAPEAPIWKQYQAGVNRNLLKDTKDSHGAILDANVNLANRCLVHPSKTDLDALFDKYPALPQAIQNVLSDLAQGRAKADAEK